MSEKLQELTERLYKEGVEKARKDAALILEEAEKLKTDLIRKAEAEAKAIIEKGRQVSMALQSRTEGELALAARQAETALKQHITSIISGDILNRGISEAFADTPLMSDLISTATGAWARSGELPDVSLILSVSQKEKFNESFGNAIKNRLDEGLKVKFSDRMKDGFRIESNSGDYVMSFSDDDFHEYFRSFLKEKTRTVLFGEK
jgi:V/A-type H+-transporting ATPase subunit E